MTPEPVILEALMWVAVILSLPAVWWAFGVIGKVACKTLFTSKTITLTIIKNGVPHEQTIYLEDTDELVKAILSMPERSST